MGEKGWGFACQIEKLNENKGNCYSCICHKHTNTILHNCIQVMNAPCVHYPCNAFQYNVISHNKTSSLTGTRVFLKFSINEFNPRVGCRCVHAHTPPEVKP